MKLATVQRVAADIYTQKENAMGKEDYARNKVVILGDEAHHYPLLPSLKRDRTIMGKGNFHDFKCK